MNAQAPLSGVLAEHFPWCTEHREAISALFKAYTARKRALGVADLDDLLLFWRALARDEVIGPRLAASFDHVLVDEYQDVNGLQVDLVRALARSRRRRSPRSATTSRRSTASARRRPSTSSTSPSSSAPSVVTLERNYRSTQPLLDAANALAAQAQRAFPKNLRADREGGAPPAVVFCRDESAQAAEVCDRVLAARERGMELRAQAVLMRTSHDSDLLELELARRRIPFVKYGGLRYLEAAHVKDFVALLRLADNGADEVAWFRVLQLVEGVGPVSAKRAIDALAPAAKRLAARWPSRARAARRAAARAGADALIEALREPARSRAPARAPSACATRWPRSSAPTTPTARCACRTSTSSWRPRSRRRDPRHFVAELVLDPPQSSADLAQPPHLDEDYLVAVDDPLRQGPRVGRGARPRRLRRQLPGLPVGRLARVDRRGAPPALRRHDASAPRAARLRARPLPPSPARQRRRPRLRQAVALPHARGPGVLRRQAAAGRPAETVRRAGRERGAGCVVSPDALFD